MQEAVETVIDAVGRVDVVVCNAGVICIGGLLVVFLTTYRADRLRVLLVTGPAIDIPLEQAKQTFDVNFFGALRMARAVIPHMAKRKHGVIVNVGSIVGEMYVYSEQS